MQELSGFAYFEVEFTRDGQVFDSKAVTAGEKVLDDRSVTDLIVISHGWNNDMGQARALYRRFFEVTRQMFDSSYPELATRSFAVMGVLWPSKKFAERELIASGAASGRSVVTDTVVKDDLDDLKAVFDDPGAEEAIDKAKDLVSRLDDSPAARKQYAEIIRSLLPRSSADDEDASSALFELESEDIMQRLSKPVLAGPQGAGRPPGAAGGTGGGGAAGVGAGPAGAAAGIGQQFSGMKSAARNLANYATYYAMKDRAGKVGSGGVHETLRRFRGAHPQLKLHLIGHSFGGRLVTAAAAGPPGAPPLRVESMTLLQAAFSHYGFAERFRGGKDGFFRNVVADKRVTGPILISHTVNDTAVGKAYPMASLLAGQVAAGLGDENDLYGGLGRNGAQKTPEAENGALLAAGGSYRFRPGVIYNLNADRFIADHGDISKKEVAQAVLAAIATV